MTLCMGKTIVTFIFDQNSKYFDSKILNVQYEKTIIQTTLVFPIQSQRMLIIAAQMVIIFNK